MIKELDRINAIPLVESYYKKEPLIEWQDYAHKGKQSGLQYREGENPFLSAVGKRLENDHTFDCLNPLFSGSVFEEIISKYNLKRTRLIWLGSNSAYTFHRDSSPRIHIPLITNPNSYLIFKNGLIKHLEIGTVYWTDTRLEHTAINGDHEWRLHLVGSVAN